LRKDKPSKIPISDPLGEEAFSFASPGQTPFASRDAFELVPVGKQQALFESYRDDLLLTLP
jgi:hypothetical protein